MIKKKFTEKEALILYESIHFYTHMLAQETANEDEKEKIWEKESGLKNKLHPKVSSKNKYLWEEDDTELFKSALDYRKELHENGNVVNDMGENFVEIVNRLKAEL